jgi:hypothetical protein
VDDIGFTKDEQREIRRINILELISTILLAIATLASAWCAYQATRWSGVQSVYFSQSAIMRAEAARKTNVETQLVGIDVGMFVLYDEALSRGDKPQADLLFQRFSPELKAATGAWLKTRPQKNPDAPPSPFAMKEYFIKESKKTRALIVKAEDLFEKAKKAKLTGDDYIFLAILFEVVLLFSSVGMKFKSLRMKALLLSISAAIYVVGIIILVSYPVY